MMRLRFVFLCLTLLMNSSVVDLRKQAKKIEQPEYILEEEDDTEDYHDDNHDHEGHSDSIMKYSYCDNDPLGPHAWDNLKMVSSSAAEQFGKNYCANTMSWKTPINIDTKKVIVPEDHTPTDGKEINRKTELSLSFRFANDDLQNLPWQFGHPTDSYHGLEVRAPYLGTFQITDKYDHIGNIRELIEHPAMTNLKHTNYDFSFMSIYYCDPKKASPGRSMHQIDGQKFPLELQFVFFSQPPKIGIGRYICDLSNADVFATTVGACVIPVIVVVIGEFGNADNPRLQPLINAAKIYEGPSFTADDMSESYRVSIKGPWSPTWLIPLSSTYYYYDSGNLPVPPCWWVARVYVVKERITISRKQFNVLTNVKTVREPLTGNKMPCTYSVLRQNRDEESPVKYYYMPYTLVGDDHRELTTAEQEKKKSGIREREDLMQGRSAPVKSSSETRRIENPGWKLTTFLYLIPLINKLL